MRERLKVKGQCGGEAGWVLSALSAQFESKTALKIKSLLGNKKKILDEGENAKDAKDAKNFR